MDLFEHQAKELFAEYGVPVPRGSLAATPVEARVIAAGFADAGMPRVVVKAQVKTGGRGKAGGVKVADGAGRGAGQGDRGILGMDIKGHTVHRVLVEEASDIAQEYYLSYLLDRADAHLRFDLLGAGRDGDRGGGARQPGGGRPDPDRPADGRRRREGGRDRRGRPAPRAGQGGRRHGGASELWADFIDEDATLVEVNPLILTGDGRVVALDGKVTLDDNAAYRQPSTTASPTRRRRTRWRHAPRPST